jgi:pyrrolidone-carboxylate peptidase
MDFKDTSNLSLEVVAHALPEYGTKIKDKDGKIGKTIALDTLPKIIRIPNEKKVETAITKIKEIKISENAGRHMCETVLRDSIRLSDHGKKFQPIFIHLPHTPELLVQSIKLDKHIHSMTEDEQKKIIKSVIKKIGSLYL